MPDLQTLAKQLRFDIISLSYAARVAHIGSCLSCADILAVAYNGGLSITPERVDDPLRDRLIFSKGHCAAALYCALCQRGFFSREELFATFNKNGGLQEHPNLGALPGVENASGSLGHGLSLGLGMALASRINNTPFRVCVIVGDGECNEGSIWEAAMLAGAQQTANLCVIVDANRWQATGRSNEITALEPLVDKWRAFGWMAVEIDGHDHQALTTTMQNIGTGTRPLAIISRTIKGKGISFMEDDNNWHYRIPNDAEMNLVRDELGLS